MWLDVESSVKFPGAVDVESKRVLKAVVVPSLLGVIVLVRPGSRIVSAVGLVSPLELPASTTSPSVG